MGSSVGIHLEHKYWESSGPLLTRECNDFKERWNQINKLMHELQTRKHLQCLLSTSGHLVTNLVDIAKH